MAERKIKIFVDSHCFDTEYQGTQTFVKELYNTLHQQFPELDLYFGAYDTEKLSSCFPFLQTSNVLQYSMRTLAFSRFIVDIPAFLKKHHINFAHFQNIAPNKVAACKYIVTLHDVLFNDYRQDFPLVYRYIRNLLFKRSFLEAHIKTTVSTYSLERINYHYHVPVEQISVISNAANDATTRIFKSKQEAKHYIKNKYGIENYILYVSRVEPRKNHELLLDKFLQLGLAKKGISLVFIGRESIAVPSFQKKLQAHCSDAQSRIFRFDEVEPFDLCAFYASCRLFVYPSKAEGFGIPPLEAAVHQVPVLCSSTSALKDFSFFHPYTFDPSNEREFEEKLLLMIESPPSYSFLNKIVSSIRERYTWVMSAEKLYQLIRQNAVA